MSYLPLSKSGLTISVLKSYLQKSVRRGLIEDACWCIVEIYSYVEIDPVAWKGISTNLINLDSKILHFVIENISGFYSNIKNIILFSETLEKNELFIFIDRLKKGINLETN